MAVTRFRSAVFSLPLVLAPQSSFACTTVEQIVRAAEGAQARVTVISDESALSRALSFMIGNADEVQPADTLIVIQKGMTAEVVLMEKGCATMRALSSRDLVFELLRRADGEDGGELI